MKAATFTFSAVLLFCGAAILLCSCAVVQLCRCVYSCLTLSVSQAMPELFESPADDEDSPLPLPSQLPKRSRTSGRMSVTASAAFPDPLALHHGSTINIQDALQLSIDAVASTDLRSATLAIKELYQSAETTVSHLVPRADALVLASKNQLVVLLATYLDENARSSKQDRQSLVRSLFMLLTAVFSSADFTRAVSLGPLSLLMHELLNLMMDSRVLAQDTLGDHVVKNCNALLALMRNQSSQADMTVAGVRVLRDVALDTNKALPICRMLSSITNEPDFLQSASPEDLALVLAGVEDFFRVHFNDYVDRELRTRDPARYRTVGIVGNILRLLTGRLGLGVMAHCTHVGDCRKAAVVRLIKHKLKRDHPNLTDAELLAQLPAPANQDTPSRPLGARFANPEVQPITMSVPVDDGLVPASAVFAEDGSNAEFAATEARLRGPSMPEAEVRAMVTECLAMVQDSARSKQGWQRLREFHLAHPGVDVLQYATSSSALFKQLIQRRLDDASRNPSSAKLLSGQGSAVMLKELGEATQKVRALEQQMNSAGAAEEVAAVAMEPVPTMAKVRGAGRKWGDMLHVCWFW